MTWETMTIDELHNRLADLEQSEFQEAFNAIITLQLEFERENQSRITVNHSPFKCPYCSNDECEDMGVESDGCSIWQEMFCPVCQNYYEHGHIDVSCDDEGLEDHSQPYMSDKAKKTDRNTYLESDYPLTDVGDIPF